MVHWVWLVVAFLLGLIVKPWKKKNKSKYIK